MVRDSVLCFSSICLNWQMPTEGQAGRMCIDTSGPSVASTAMVHSTARIADQLSIAVTSERNTTPRPLQQIWASPGTRAVTAGCVEIIRRFHSTEGISKKAPRLILSRWSKGTNSAGWNKYSSWCYERGKDPISCDVQVLVDFLADIYEQRLQHRSINVIIQSVVSLHTSRSKVFQLDSTLQ